MNDTTASDCTCPSGDGSLRHPCPAHPFLPAISHEQAIKLARAAAYSHCNEHSYLPQTWEVAANWQPHDWVISAIMVAADTAPPVDSWFADQLTAIGEVTSLASTPAAPGIDLPAMPVTTDREPDDSMPAGYFESNLDWARRPENIEALEWFIENHEAIRRLIDASPKGDHVVGVNKMVQDSPKGGSFDVNLFVRDCCEAEKDDPDNPDTICISVDALTVIAQRHADASPKGGSTGSLRFELTNGQIAQLADFAGTPVAGTPLDEQDVLVIQHADGGHSGPGLYAHYDELPEEGAIYLDGQLPDSPKGGSDGRLTFEEWVDGEYGLGVLSEGELDIAFAAWNYAMQPTSHGAGVSGE